MRLCEGCCTLLCCVVFVLMGCFIEKGEISEMFRALSPSSAMSRRITKELIS